MPHVAGDTLQAGTNNWFERLRVGAFQPVASSFPGSSMRGPTSAKAAARLRAESDRRLGQRSCRFPFGFRFHAGVEMADGQRHSGQRELNPLISRTARRRPLRQPFGQRLGEMFDD